MTLIIYHCLRSDLSFFLIISARPNYQDGLGQSGFAMFDCPFLWRCVSWRESPDLSLVATLKGMDFNMSNGVYIHLKWVLHPYVYISFGLKSPVISQKLWNNHWVI